MANSYIDGKLVCSTPYSLPINVMDDTAPFIIGRSLAGPDEYSDGLIEAYRIYYRVLSTTEMDTFFELGKGEKAIKRNYDVYPNPVKDLITIRATSNMQHSQNSIIDITRRKFSNGYLSQPVNTIALRQLPAGVYYLNVNDGIISNKKTIKQ